MARAPRSITSALDYRELCWYRGLGAAGEDDDLGLGQGFGLLFGAVSIIAAVGIVLWLFVFNACRSHWLTFALGLISGGIFGNLYDRLGFHGLQDQYSGGVRDWILLRYGTYTWPNFNIADSLLVVGAIMLAIYSFSNPEEANPSVQKSPDRSAT